MPAGGEDDAGARAGQHLSEPSAKPGGCAGHDRDPAIERGHGTSRYQIAPAAAKRSISSPGAVKDSAARSSTTRTVPPGRAAARACGSASIALDRTSVVVIAITLFSSSPGTTWGRHLRAGIVSSASIVTALRARSARARSSRARSAASNRSPAATNALTADWAGARAPAISEWLPRTAPQLRQECAHAR